MIFFAFTRAVFCHQERVIFLSLHVVYLGSVSLRTISVS